MHLEVLCNIKNPRYVQRTFVIVITERVGKISGVNLPYTHEDELMVWVARKEHAQ
jgi:hypothetical protein